MIFHYAGKYDGDESKLPQREHPENAVPFKEPQDMKKLAWIANGGALIVTILLAIPFFYVCRGYFFDKIFQYAIGCILPMVILIPHEFLHGICFRKDVYMYQYLEKGMLFVVGTEDFSKLRFVFMSMLPNLIFGFLPYILYFFMPQQVWLGMFGLVCIGSGFGDYMNVFHAVTQMPKGAKTYLSGMHSFWYLP